MDFASALLHCCFVNRNHVHCLLTFPHRAVTLQVVIAEDIGRQILTYGHR